MGQNNVMLDEKRLRDLEQGPVQTAVPAVPARTGGIGNPAPLGLLCFGMTTCAPSLVGHANCHRCAVAWLQRTQASCLSSQVSMCLHLTTA